MKRFKFRLEALLRYREHLERQAQLELAAAQNAVLECEQRIADRRRKYETDIESFSKETREGISSDRFRQYSQYLGLSRQLMEAEHVRRERLLKNMEKKRAKLTQCAVGRRAICNLKERRENDYYEEMRKLEQKEQDDMVLIRKARELTS